MAKSRYLESFIAADLSRKMVFLGGPRQVGKTTLGQLVDAHKALSPALYLNWDRREDRQAIVAGKFAGSPRLIIFDELHKYRPWKNYIKGLYDTERDRYKFLVTGSTRLDVYRRGEDSLLGRYHYYRLHPFSVAELLRQVFKSKPGQAIVVPESKSSATALLADLLQWGGFPESLLARDDRFTRRWHAERLDRIIKNDIRDLESVRDLSGLQVLSELLPAKVGSLLSLNSLRGDLEVAHATVTLWVDILERFYYHFRIYPYQNTTIRSLRKEPKVYLWDWSLLENQSAKLENIVASHLLKLVHFLADAHGYKTELYFLRDREGREVDFLVTHNRRPWFAVEVKNTDETVSPHLLYFKERLKIPHLYQVVQTPDVDFTQHSVRVISVDTFLSALV